MIAAVTQHAVGLEEELMYLSCASVCYRCYHDPAENEVDAMLKDIATTEYDSIGVHGVLRSPRLVERFDVDDFRAKVERLGIKRVIFRPPGFGGGTPGEVETQARSIAKVVRLAETFSGDVLSCGLNPSSASRTPEHFVRFIHCIERVLELTSDSSVRLAFENHPDVLLQFPQDFERLLRRIDHPRVGLCPDTGHLMAEGVGAAEVIRSFREKIYEVHIKDVVGRRSVGIGRGEVAFPDVIDALREGGYAGSLTVELEVSDVENVPIYVREAYAYLRGLLRMPISDRKRG